MPCPARLRVVPLLGLFFAGAFACGALVAGSEPELTPAAVEDPAAARNLAFDELAREVALLEQHGNILKKVVRLVKASVVHIEARKDNSETATFTARRRAVEEAGSGVIIERGGKMYVLTNRHVIKGASLRNIKIGLADGRTLYPSKVWEDIGTDVAVMAIEAPGLVPARLGNSDLVEIGDFVLAVGSPFGLSHSVTYGIISAKGRRDLKLGDDGVRYQDFLQTDAAINPGNSGGPLLSLRGEVIGLNTAIASSSGGSEGIGFTIPVNMAMNVASQLIDRGTVARAYLGVQLNSKYGPDDAHRLGIGHLRGAHVTGTTPNSPAALAQFQADDVILEFNGVAVEDDNHLVNLVSLTPVNTEVSVKLVRGGKATLLRVTVGDRSQFDPRP